MKKRKKRVKYRREIKVPKKKKEELLNGDNSDRKGLRTWW